MFVEMVNKNSYFGEAWVGCEGEGGVLEYKKIFLCQDLVQTKMKSS